MTSERDFDRTARAWLEFGPTEAPDRAVDAVLRAVGSTPQVRPPVRWPTWRSIHMTRLTGAALAVALLAVVGGGILLTRGGDQSGAPPASTAPSTLPASPSVAPSSAGDAGVPAEMQGTWMGGPKPQLRVADGAGTALMLTPTGLAISQSAGATVPALSARPSVPAAGRLRVVSAASDAAGCPAGATGDYAWELSASGRRLTITGGADPCRARLASLPGTWLRMACRGTADNCLGDLDPGTYATQFLSPRLKPGEDWQPHFGAVTYTVPDGWANAGDWPADYELVPSPDYAAYGPDGGPPGQHREIDIWALPAMTDQSTDCTGTEVTTVDRSVDGFVAWLWDQPRFVTARPVALTIDGHPAKSIDVRLAPGWTGTCPDLPAGTHAAQILTHRGASGSDEAIGIVDQEQFRLIFIDLGGGDLVAIVVDATDPGAFDALTTQAMPIIESMTFE